MEEILRTEDRGRAVGLLCPPQDHHPPQISANLKVLQSQSSRLFMEASLHRLG